ncbi:hypothetical protein [Marinicella rhabdoformis]|uniref:hypothetical protein n=1 Tax=Marinicella rhabdoformis TaxID=2580566 RepID=UPI0012AEC73E|nr:hypothetical protein [Marinicella rhabdoformis]
MNKAKYLATLLITLISGTVNAFVTVGQGQECDYNNLFTAYEDNDLEIRVTNEQVFTNNFIIEKFKIIKGGYDNCLAAQAGVVGNEKSKWSGLNALNNTVIEVDVNLAILATVIIENFEIYDGKNESASGAGGIKVSGKSNVIIRDSIIYDNGGNEGGGLHVFGEDAILTLENTVVRNNTATGYGGGIYCSDGAHLNIDGNSTIHDNEAALNGGGLFGGNDCDIVNNSGWLVDGRNRQGVSFNTANKGGGIYLQTGAQIEMSGTYYYPGIIKRNYTDAANGLSGGGLYLTGEGTTAVLINSHIINNDSSGHGAGMVVTDHATLYMSQAAEGCEYLEAEYCSQISNNWVQVVNYSGGAGYISDYAEVNISQTEISHNKSILVNVFNLDEAAYLRLEGNLIRQNDGLGQSPAYSLFHIGEAGSEPSQLDYLYNTVVANDVDRIFTANNISGRQVLNVFNSIIWDNGTIFNFNGPATAQIDCTIVHESASLSGNVGAVLTNDPLFINAAIADYRPSLASDAIDFCDNSLFPAQFNDMNNNPRGFDMASVNNAFGTYDAGAYEYAPDIIFRSGFE